MIVVAPSTVNCSPNCVFPVTVKASEFVFFSEATFMFNTVPPSTVKRPEIFVFPSILISSVKFASPSTCKLPSISTFPVAEIFL